MKHGYTNRTERCGGSVRKTYLGPDARGRQDAELRALTSVQGHVPVPAVVRSGDGWLETTYISGRHGQDLVDDGAARQVLGACGRVLRRLHALDARLLDQQAPEHLVIQHGDFGPNNVLLSPAADRVVGILDWELSRVGPPITDIAWCEWVIRMHHPHAVPSLDAFFDAYGAAPPWGQRQAEMVRRCERLTTFTARWDASSPAITMWRQRTRAVESWSE